MLMTDTLAIEDQLNLQRKEVLQYGGRDPEQNTVFETLHRLRPVDRYRGHQLCEDPMNGVRWERMPQGDHTVPSGLSITSWRRSVDHWLSHYVQDDEPQIVGETFEHTLAYDFWKQVLDQVLVSRPHLKKVRSVERQIAPAITSPRVEEVTPHLMAVARQLNLPQLQPSDPLVIAVLGSLNLLERDVLHFADLTTDRMVTYPGPYVRCRRTSLNTLGSVYRRYRISARKRHAARAVAERLVTTARSFSLDVPEAPVAFPHLYPPSDPLPIIT